ncbi:MAG: hypothetical protein IPO22_07790 [Anaerolineales bacterium]|nr:hypothetical protein [Anaerolineales bacterium]
MQEQKQREKVQLQRALDALNHVELRARVLTSCKDCGMTTQELAELESREEYRSVYSALEWLVSPSRGLLPFLNSVPMRMIDREGRPPKAYLLTDFGAQALRLLDPQATTHALELGDVDAWQHRFVQAQIYTLSRKMNWKANLEKVISFDQGKQNIRCDVLLQLPDTRLYVEVEQDLPRNNLWRAVEKFEHWREYAKTQNQRVDMLFVFNLPIDTATTTIQNWREVLGRVEASGKLNCRISYISVAELNEKDLSTAIDLAIPLKAIEVKKDEAPTLVPIAPKPVSAIPVYAQRFFVDYMNCVRELQNAKRPEDQLMSFFNLSLFIYEASYQKDSVSVKYATLPRASIWMLRHYLELPANQAMLAELKQALNWTQKKGSQMGLIMFRSNMTSIIWDVFLRHHGFSRGGALNVMFYIPDFQDIRSDFWVKIDYSDYRGGLGLGEYRTKDFCVAISWMLTGLFSYSEELGLGQRPWKVVENKVNKKRGKG